MSENRDETLTVEVSKIVHGGYGLARADKRVIFIPGGVPGDVLEVVVTEAKKSHAFADIISVIQPSAHRVPHIWPEADVTRKPHERVGGADFGHLPLEYQREAKRDVIREALTRQGDVSPDVCAAVTVAGVAGLSNGTGWRTRLTLHVDRGGTPGQRGFRSHRIIKTATLPLAHPEIVGLAAHTSSWPGVESIHLGRSSSGGTWLMMAGDKPASVTEVVAGHTLSLDTDVFWQVHHSAPEVLTDAVTRAVDWELWDEGAANLDLYGGVGLFAVSLAVRGGVTSHIVSVESHPRASRFASANLAAFPHATAVTSDVLAYVRAQSRSIGEAERERYRRATILLDPPRSGAARAVIDALVTLSPRQIVYVACDPVAFARDQKLLSEAGYTLAFIEAFDLFPHTHHVEMVASFVGPLSP